MGAAYLVLHVLQACGEVDGEDDEDHVALGVAERPEPVVLLLPCGVPERELDELAVGFVLDQSMDVSVSGVVPYALCFELERVKMCCGGVVSVRVCPAVTAAADVSAYETDPEVRRAPAVGAVGALGGGGSRREGKWTCGSCRIR